MGPVLAASLVPALVRSGALFGLPMVLAWALVVLELLRRWGSSARGPEALRRPGVLTACALSLPVLAVALASIGGESSYSHVADVLIAKARHGGVRPDDPSGVPFDARLLWQGPFEAISLDTLFAWLAPTGGLVLLLGAGATAFVAWRDRARGTHGNRGPGGAGFELWLLAFTLVCLPVALAIGRTVVVFAVCAPALLAVMARLPQRRAMLLTGGALALVQLGSFVRTIGAAELAWYWPPERQREIASLVDWVDANVADDEPIAGDFMNSPAILLHAGNPIVLQPKYETPASRAKAQLFLETFFHGTTDALAEVVVDAFGCELLLVDRYTLGVLSPWVAGVRGAPAEGTAVARLLATDDESLGAIPGFELLYRSPPEIVGVAGVASDYFRLYRIAPAR